ncbi:DoxX family protein [Alterisphingorhabdus coralli]|uniref:DoxX family protein n=1 Tax=Alterisphingorhabdus coralli TaxID=3071408 RepID=A0AA97I2Z6_9SPHN|nr:DoxX family protein [Parasphingorhabdus sp. SCSIO 66989]WOE76235.1 DoxX family protein [Parasphingorhabdus sp. SCSIO 66989]
MTNMINKFTELMNSSLIESIALLIARLALGGVFWRSATSRLEEGSWTSLSEGALYQFSDAPFNNVPVINGDFGAYFTTYTELTVAVLLFLGLATRFSALATIGMALVIQIFVFPTFAHLWATVALWAAVALFLIIRGGGLFSVDKLIGNKLG